MKHFYACILFLLTSFSGVNAQATFEWGTAEWNIQDGWVFESIDDFNATGVKLTYPNPTNYKLTMLNVVAIDYDVFIDDSTDPVRYVSSGRGVTEIVLSYPFVEGHKYKIVTNGAALAQVNLATFTTDTLWMDDVSYSISFTIKGPELVKTIDLDGYMSLSNTSQDYYLTYSIVDIQSILDALQVSDLSQTAIFGLQTTGEYVGYEWYGPDYFDGWRDADGDYTLWSGGWNRLAGHNSYPAVYCIKLNQTADTVTYYFYDYWKEYDPDDTGEMGGGTIEPTKHRAPETSYNSMIWTWDNGDGTTTDYNRMWRCDEGKDYKASFVIKANNKMARINATLHFVSMEEYEANYTAIKDVVSDNRNKYQKGVYNLSGTPQTRLQKGLNIVNGKKIFVK